MLDPKLVAQAIEISNKIMEMIKNQKADLALLALLAATATLRRKTTFSIDDVLERFKAIDGVVEVGRFFVQARGKKS